MSIGNGAQRHVVVFDCNIYLDVAHLLGAPFTWDKFHAAAARLARQPLPHPGNRAFDSLRATALCTSGTFAGDETLEVWSSAHIDKIVRGKAAQSTRPDPFTGYRGLGWPAADAEGLLSDLVRGLIDDSGGGTVNTRYPDGNPPLDHEDGMVYGACRHLAGDDPLARVYCVTRDRGFLAAYEQKELTGHSAVLSPVRFVELVRAARRQYVFRRLSGA